MLGAICMFPAKLSWCPEEGMATSKAVRVWKLGTSAVDHRF